MSWGTKRRNFIILIIALIILIPTGYILFNLFYQEPTCFDGRQNGKETGIDCGGECALICERGAREMSVLWQRFFPISPGLYNVIAMVENPNADAGIKNISYRFQLFDRNNILLVERTGSVRVYPNKTFPIVEIGLSTGQLTARRLAFEFTEEAEWEKQDPVDQTLVIRGQKLVNEDTEPRINAIMTNTSINAVSDIDIVAIVYDGQGNAIGSSSTYIEKIARNQLINLVFTWSEPFERKASRIEIIPLYEAVQ